VLPLIAVIDNSEAMRVMFALIAQDEGWTISGHSYAEVSLATIQELKPDLIIVDLIEQRIGEGWEFLQLLKMEESTAAIPIVISTTMSVLPLEIQGYLASQDINVIAKPFAVADFIAVVRQALNGKSALLLSTTKRLPILLVEDNAELSDGFITVLQLEGYLVAAVANGQLVGAGCSAPGAIQLDFPGHEHADYDRSRIYCRIRPRARAAYACHHFQRPG
jgi:CheY-like chemotaxis protein